MKVGVHQFVLVAALVVSFHSAVPSHGQSATSSATPAATEGLVDVPQPDLSKADPPVQEQIRAAQKSLADILAKPGSSPIEKALVFGSLGEIYQAYEFDDAALACYTNASKLQPQEFRWPYFSGYLHQRTGDSDSAVRDFERALAANPKGKSAMIRLANAELSVNQVEEAKGWLIKASGQNPPPAVLYGLGKVALIEHQYPEALKYFRQVLAREPQASSIHYQLAMAYRGLGDMTHMQEQLQLRGEVEPTIEDPYLDEIKLLKQGKIALLERGSKAVREGRLKDAVATYRQMVKLYPTDPILHTYLGVALAKSGQRAEALQEYAYALQLNSQNPTVHYDMGILLIDMGRKEEAVSHFRSAVQLDPGSVPAHFQLANLLMLGHEDDAAVKEYGFVVSLQPQNGFARLMQAMAAVHAGAYAQARSLLQDSMAALPRDPDIANALARVLAAAPDPAVRDERRALEIIQNLVQNQMGDGLEDGITFAMALASVGHFQEAAGYQQAIIQQLEQERRFGLAKKLRQNLALYEQGKPCRKPWFSDDPIFTPVPSKAQLASQEKMESSR